MNENQKPRLLIISAILPFPLNSGQRVRVFNKIYALRQTFQVTFLSYAPPVEVAAVQQKVAEQVDRAVILPMHSRQSLGVQLWYQVKNQLQAAQTGLRASNHLVGDVELTTKRLLAACQPEAFDLVLYEYWHTHATTTLFRELGIPTVLDMHDLCWRVMERRLNWLPGWLRGRRVQAYRRQEEAAWAKYDLLVAINREEERYVRSVLPAQATWYTPMGIDTEAVWQYQWLPANPPRIAFYGALGSLGNQNGVNWCLERIMPAIWTTYPNLEFWIVGGTPSKQIQQLTANPRIKVTGFVPDVAQILKQMSLVLCPWQGKFGFRSRLIEVMALGVPVVATPDAVFGMGLEAGQGLLLAETDAGLGQICLNLLADGQGLCRHSRLARQQVEAKFSFPATYGALSQRLQQMVVAQ